MVAITSLLATGFALATCVLAQGGEVPACLVPCNTKANNYTGCALTDLLCHCEHANQVLDIMIPCLFYEGNNCTDLKESIYSFEAGVAALCSTLDITTVTNSTKLPPPVLLVPGNGSPYNGTTTLPLPRPTHTGGHYRKPWDWKP